GVPKIPTSLAETVERYSNFRAATLTSWHPTRREMLIATRFADVSEIHRVQMPGGARSQLTFYPDAVTNAQYEPTQGNYFVFSKDVGGGEFYQLYRDDLDTGEVTLLTDGKSRNTGAVWWEIQQRRQRNLYHHRQGIRVSSARLHRLEQPPAHLSQQRDSLGCGGVRSLRGWPEDRLRYERGRIRDPAHLRHRQQSRQAG